MGRRKRCEAKPDLAADVTTALRDYPDLYLITEGATLRVCGRFPVADDDGTIERFAVEITLDQANPDELPVVYPLDGRIARDADHHVNPDNTGCVGVPEEWLVKRPDARFGSFLAGPVRDYFLGQALLLRGEPWPAGERSHGTRGAFEAFGEIIGFDDDDQLRRTIRLLTQNKIGGHLECPCGSGRKLRACHLDLVRRAQTRIPRQIAALMLKRIAAD